MCLPVQPFKIEREWERFGLKCAVTMNREQGFRCGYVRVPPFHPASLLDYDYLDVDVHGGLTFGRFEKCLESDGSGKWFGFDCAHCDDSYAAPSVPKDYVWQSERARLNWEEERKWAPSLMNSHYWTEDEVAAETERLAEQVSKSVWRVCLRGLLRQVKDDFLRDWHNTRIWEIKDSKWLALASMGADLQERMRK